MSEEITHFGIADDTRLLALASPRISQTFKEVLQDHHDVMRLGALTRRTETFAGPLIKELRGRWGERKEDDAKKLAFCLGTLAHRAADRMMKPVFRSQTSDGAYPHKMISYYHDIFVFDRVYNRGKREPYTPEALSPTVPFPSLPDLDADVLETYFRVLFQRTLLATHTLKPDEEQADAWLSALFDRLQTVTVDLRHYHQALTDPDPELIRRAITDVNFYNEADPILAMAEELRAGASISAEAFLERYRLGDRSSLYTRALSMAYGYFQTASEFWLGEVREELFQDAITR